jgi:hypothetical protein
VKSNIVYQYFKKETAQATIIFQVDTIQLKGTQLTIPKSGDMELEEIEFESNILETLQAEGFTTANPLEFHLIINGLHKNNS